MRRAFLPEAGDLYGSNIAPDSLWTEVEISHLFLSEISVKLQNYPVKCIPEKLKDNYVVLPGLDKGLRDTIVAHITSDIGSCILPDRNHYPREG